MSDMTRKEAIEILKDWDGYFIGHNSDDVNEALDMAIASLETDEAYQLMYEQPELCADCISRKDTIEYLKQVTVTDGITFETGFKQILLDIENMPGVLPKANKPKEKWILKNFDTSVLKIECPICGFHRNILNKTLAKFNYCPNCGADMREVEE